MKGLILVLASPLDVHADSIVSHCNDAGVGVVRINTEDFWPQISTVDWKIDKNSSSAKLVWSGRIVDAEKVQAVYCRDFSFAKCPSSEEISEHLRYAEARSALYGFLRNLEGKYWMNRPWYDEMADNKPYQLECAQKIGFNIPKTLVTNKLDSFLDFYSSCNGDVIIKQLSEICLIDESEYKSLIQNNTDKEPTAYGFYTNRVRKKHLKHLDEIRASPCLFQERLRKKADIRVTVVSEKLFPVFIDSQSYPESTIDFRHRINLPVSNYQLPDNVKKMIFYLMNQWGLEFAAFDFVLNECDELVFIEANVEGNWLWLEHELTLPISRTIVEHLIAKGKF
jgi:glutathione synthase/RimK-type ligase-like ATP-grasp enzyme